MESILTIIVILLLVFILSLISMYNRMVALNIKVDEGYSSIDVALQKRYDLISNLVEVVKGYTKYESETLVALVRERSIQRRNEMMNEEEAKLFAVAEGYPELKANEQYKKLMNAMADCEEHLQAARRFYNGNVRAFNTCIQQFPYNMVASSKGYEPREFFVFEEE